MNRQPRIASLLLLAAASSLAASCTSAPELALPSWCFDPNQVFPADRSLARAEDGIALRDGRLIVADQIHGLRLVASDGSSDPFGDLPAAGYANDPPRKHGAPNGVSFEPDGLHLLVTDVIGGEIYRVELASGATEIVFDHRHGVNAAVRDSSGAIWFTQSARNREEQGEMGLFTPVDVPVADGALWRLPFADGRFASEAVLARDGLRYANGIVLDEARGALYLCELCADRVLRFPLDVATGELGPPTTLIEMASPDNIERDVDGRLWIASPIRNEVLVVDPDTGAVHSAFHQQSAAQAELSAEWTARGASATPRLELITPALFEPLPGILTGIILGASDGSVYLSGLGNALIRLRASPMPEEQLVKLATRYAAAWSSQEPEELASFYAEGGSLVVNLGTPSTGRAAIAAKAKGFMDAFPDMVVVMDSVREEAGRVRFDWTWTGTNSGPGGTGRSVRISGFEEWTMSPGGRIAESRGHYDEAEYERQVSGG